MSDLIDREALLHKAWLVFYVHEDEMEKKDPDYLVMKRLYEQNGFEIFHSTVVNAPTIEARPKGKWLPKGRWHIDPQCIEYTCSICGRRIMREERLNVIERYPFCHCGADMRGDV